MLFALAAIGPNAVVGAIIGPSLNRPNQRQIREIARQLNAIDSVPLGMEMTVFFSQTGFTPTFLYDVKRKPVVPSEIPYDRFRRVVLHDSGELGGTLGSIEYKTPPNIVPPRRPKPLERILLGKDLYESLIKDADEFEKNGPSEFWSHQFHYEGEHHRTRAEFLMAKFEEYALSEGAAE